VEKNQSTSTELDTSEERKTAEDSARKKNKADSGHHATQESDQDYAQGKIWSASKITRAEPETGRAARMLLCGQLKTGAAQTDWSQAQGFHGTAAGTESGRAHWGAMNRPGRKPMPSASDWNEMGKHVELAPIC
jgi:hypothetical protein